jgi:hypothetical protein
VVSESPAARGSPAEE